MSHERESGSHDRHSGSPDWQSGSYDSHSGSLDRQSGSHRHSGSHDKLAVGGATKEEVLNDYESGEDKIFVETTV